MDRMTEEDPVENGHEDSDSEGEDQTYTAELHKTVGISTRNVMSKCTFLTGNVTQPCRSRASTRPEVG